MIRPFLVRIVMSAVLSLGAYALAAPAPGERVPPFTLPAADGGTASWAPGRVTVFSFCAFWCDTWKEQGTRLSSAFRALNGLPVDVFTVSVDGRWAERAGGKPPGRLLLDPGRRITESLGIHAVPTTLVVGTNGRIEKVFQGIVRGADLSLAVREAVGASPADPVDSVYLTFDDFPSGPDDHGLLDALRAAGVKATFFCIGVNVERLPDIVRRAAAEGHSLQMHSWDHHAAHPDLPRNARILQETTGVQATLYRPPGQERVLQPDGTPLSKPTVNPYDYTRPGREELSRRILAPARPGVVILLHAGVRDTVEALPDLLETLKKRGIDFATLTSDRKSGIRREE